MFKFDEKTCTITETAGGYSDYGVPIRDTYVMLSPGLNHQRAVLYEPVQLTEKSQVAVISIHSDNNYSCYNIAPELAKRGYRSIGGQVLNSRDTLDKKLLDIKRAILFARALPGVKKVVIMGHSGGATLMSAYQRAAENGIASLKTDGLIYKAHIEEELPPADGIMLIDSNWGNGCMTLFSVDPAVIDDGCGVKIDPELDIFNPANGFDPEGSHYDDKFIAKFCKAQAQRNNRIVKMAIERLDAIEHGKGLYNDDEPFCVAGTSQIGPCNKMFPQDIRLLAHTRKPCNLLHNGGIITKEIAYSLREARGGRSFTPSVNAATVSTVREYLSNRAVFAKDDFRFTEDRVVGVDWASSFCNPPSNTYSIHNPILCMGMTGGYEYLAAEVNYDHAASEDKTLTMVEAASHDFRLNERARDNHGQYGDTEKTLFDYIDTWLAPRFVG